MFYKIAATKMEAYPMLASKNPLPLLASKVHLPCYKCCDHCYHYKKCIERTGCDRCQYNVYGECSHPENPTLK